MDWPEVCAANRTFYCRPNSLHFVIDSKGLSVEITEIFQLISNRLVGVLGRESNILINLIHSTVIFCILISVVVY